MAVSCVAFYRGVAEGDLSVVEAYWSQLHVRTEVQETETYIRTTTPEDAAFLRNGESAWYYTNEPWEPHDCLDYHYPDFLPGIAVDNDHVHVIEWLFSREGIPATLQLLLPQVMSWARSTRFPDATEVLLTSHIFTNILSSEEQQALLDNALRFVVHVPVADTLIAHGARVNPESGLLPVRSAADVGALPLVKRLIDLGAYTIGARDLEL